MVQVLWYNFREKNLFNSDANILKVVKEVGLKFAFGFHSQQICEYSTTHRITKKPSNFFQKNAPYHSWKLLINFIYIHIMGTCFKNFKSYYFITNKL